jgi:hypothetical protein
MNPLGVLYNESGKNTHPSATVRWDKAISSDNNPTSLTSHLFAQHPHIIPLIFLPSCRIRIKTSIYLGGCADENAGMA